MSVNLKGNLLELFQKKWFATPDNIFDMQSIHGQFRCTINFTWLQSYIPIIGDVCNSKKEAEKSALMKLFTSPEMVKSAVETWNPIGTINEIAAAESVVSAISSSHKEQLNILLQKVCLLNSTNFNTNITSGGFVCEIVIEMVFPDRVFAGVPCSTKKMAEFSAAMTLMTDEPAKRLLENWSDNKAASSTTAEDSVGYNLTVMSQTSSTFSVPIAGENVLAAPAGTAPAPAPNSTESWNKDVLCKRFQEKGVQNISDFTTYDTVDTASGFQYAFSIPSLGLGRSFAGQQCSGKKAAQNSAIQAFMADDEAREAFKAWRPLNSIQGSVKSSSGSASICGSVVALKLGMVDSATQEAAEVMRAEEVTEQETRSSISDLSDSSSQKLSTPISPAPFNAISKLNEAVQKTTKQSNTLNWTVIAGSLGGFIASLTIPLVFGNRMFSSDVACSNKAEAMQSTASAVLLNIEAMQAISCWEAPIVEFDKPVHKVLCSACEEGLGSAEDFFFYHVSDSEVQFALKPELHLSRMGTLKSNEEPPHTVGGEKADSENGKGTTADSVPLQKKTLLLNYGDDRTALKDVAVHCGHCKCKVGAQLGTGPDQSCVVSFKMEKVMTEHGPFRLPSWRVAAQTYRTQFDHRDTDTYFSGSGSVDPGTHNTSAAATTAIRRHKSRKVEPMVSLKSGNISNDGIEWEELLVPNHYPPYDYQIEAFRLSLLVNLIVVIPTGAGKTLIAAMTMHRMKLLNPGRLVAMIVDRVPLVYQQKDAIGNATELSLLGLCGTSRTKANLTKVIDGVFDGIVVTAGLLEELLRSDDLRITDFSVLVFDECHHVTGNHKYRDILKRVENVSKVKQPLLLGLSASPTQAKTVAATQAKIQEMKSDFLEARLYRPSIPVHNKTTTPVKENWVVVSPTADQTAKQLELATQLSSVLNRLAEVFVVEDHLNINVSHCNCKGKWQTYLQVAVNVLASSDCEVSRKLAKDIKLVLLNLQVNYLFGPRLLDTVMFEESEEKILETIKEEYRNSKPTVGTAVNVMNSESDCTAVDSTSNAPQKDCGTAATEKVPAVASSLTPEECTYMLARCSSQLRELYTRLSACTDTNKVLVFVETRSDADLLTKVLNLLVPQFNATKIIGQSGYDGMNWHGSGGQEIVLEQFVTSKSRLLVCTSVLEEGLDVKDCDLVFRFGGRPTLIQFVQSRGRARAKKSTHGTLVLIYTKEEKRHFDTMRDQEDLVDSALTGESAELGDYFTAQDKQAGLADVIQSNDEKVLSALRAAALDNKESDESLGDFNYCMQLFTSAPLNSLEKSVLSAVEDISFAREITRLEVLQGGANVALSSTTAGVNIFAESDSAVLVNIRSTARNAGDFQRRLARHWNFSLGEQRFAVCTPLLDPKAAVVSGEKENNSTFVLSSNAAKIEFNEVQSVAVGHMSDQSSFIVGGHLGGSCVRYDRLEIEAGKELKLVGVSTADDSKAVSSVRCSVATLNSCVYVSASKKEESVTLYLLLRSTPKMLHHIGDKDTERIAVPLDCSNLPMNVTGSLQRDLNLLAGHPVLAVTLNKSQWDRVVAVFSDPAVLGVPALLTKINHTDAPTAEDTRTLTKLLISDAVQTTGPEVVEGEHVLPSSLSPENVAFLHRTALWTFAALKSDVYCLSLTPHCLAHVFDALHGALSSGQYVQVMHCVLAMQELSQRLRGASLWFDAQKLFSELLTRSQSSAVVASKCCDEHIRSALEGEVSEGHRVVHRVLVTPSRIHILPSGHIKTNRLIRKHGESNMFAYAYFSDEQRQNMFDKETFQSRYRDILERGFDLCGQHFQFIACSNSQLREQTCVFVAGDTATVWGIRDSLIDRTLLNKKGWVKYLSRLGLFCTADHDTIEIDKNRVQFIKDVKTCGTKQQLLTDGAGRISEALLRRVCSEYFALHGRCPSMIQVRISGWKGTLLCDPTLNGTGIDLVITESMVKCDSDHLTLCVVKEATYNPVRMNREIINLLCSATKEGKHGGDWAPHQRLVDLENEILESLSAMLLSQDVALRYLRDNVDAETQKALEQLVKAKVNVLQEPHWLSLLQFIYHRESRALRKKTHIAVQHGCLLMGGPDPKGVLKDGEIFLRVKRPRKTDRDTEKSESADSFDYEYETIVGDVIIYRNPCLHPGDVRCVEAVDHPDLHFWTDVVLLPCSETVARSLSAECSGGDLDGDMFSVIWDKGLVMPAHREFPALDYNAVTDTGSGDNKDNVQEMTEAEFLTSAMCNASLGRIANLHLALCDQTADGARSNLAQAVAREQSKAVDYPKTGIPPCIPSEAQRQVRAKGYPDFMENKTKETYVSEKTLGDLYRTVCAVSCDLEFENRTLEFLADPLFNKDGYRALLEASQAVYTSYVLAVKQLMVRFGLKSEAELVLGAPYEWSEDFALDHDAASSALRAAWKVLRSNYRHQFVEMLSGEEDKAQLAAAWYFTAYARKDCFHSFAWIVSDILCEVRRDNLGNIAVVESASGGGNLYLDRDIAGMVGGSALGHWKSTVHNLNFALSIKTEVFKRVKRSILNSVRLNAGDELLVEMYGSVSLLLCDHESDVDVFVKLSSLPCTCVEDEIRLLDTVVFSAVDGDSKELKKTGIPLIVLTVTEGPCTTSVDICAKQDGYLKARHMRALFDADPAVFLLFSCVKQWAQHCGLIGGFVGEKRKVALNSGQLQALILHFLQQSSAGGEETRSVVDQAVSQSDLNLISSASNADTQSLGRKLFGFFRYYAAVQTTVEFVYRWPVAGDVSHRIAPEDLKVLATRCQRACHYLAVSREWEFLLDQCAAYEVAATTLTQTLSRQLSDQLAGNTEYHATRLSVLTKAHVVIKELNPTSSGANSTLVVIGRGSCRQIQLLRAELLQMIHYGRSHSYGAIMNRSSAYFMENSTLLHARGIDSTSAMFALSPLFASRQLTVHSRHKLREISTLELRSSRKEEWRDAFCSNLVTKVLQQLQQMKTETSEDLEYSVHLGTFYMLDASGAFEKRRNTISIADIETAMANGRRNRGFDKVDRGEYDETSKVVRGKDKGKNANDAVVERLTRQYINIGGGGGGSGGGGGNGPAGRESKKKASVATSFMSSVPMRSPETSSTSSVSGGNGSSSKSGSDWVAVDSNVDAASTTSCSENEQVGISPAQLCSEQEEMEAKFRSIVTSLGYREYHITPSTSSAESLADSPSPVLIGVPGTRLLVPTCLCRMVEVNPSPTYSVTVCLGAQMQIFKVKERFLSWVHATLLAGANNFVRDDLSTSSEDTQQQETAVVESAGNQVGGETADTTESSKSGFVVVENKQQSDETEELGDDETKVEKRKQPQTAPLPLHRQQFRDHDVRFKIGTNKKVAENSSLFLAACPNGNPPIVIDPSTGHPAPNPDIPKEKVAFVRQIKKRVHFISRSYDVEDRARTTPVLMAVFAHGTHFSGEGLAETQPFIDVSLEVDVRPLVDWVRGEAGKKVSLSEITEWLQSVTREVLRVSDEIRQVW